MNRRNLLKAGGALAAASAFSISTGALGQPMMFNAQYNPRQSWEMKNAGSTLPEAFRHPELASYNPEEVGARIVLSFDCSGSIDYHEFRTQLDVIASALESDDIYDAIFSPGGAGSVAICLADFGSTAALRVPWVDIRKGDQYKLHRLAREIRALLRREDGSTSHVRALDNAMECLDNCPWQGKRSIVDVITDGQNNHGGTNAQVIENVDKLAREYNTTVNTLLTVTSNSEDHMKWFWDHLVTKDQYYSETLDPGFVKAVATQVSARTPGAIVEYKDAMRLALRRQLILETAQYQPEPTTQFAMNRRDIFKRFFKTPA